jgi:glucosamine--fructose-6-phosphate aminotransferase (isomerizing)
MCGIVGAVSSRDMVPVLVQGLQRLEYRGYDSCGVAVVSPVAQLDQPAGLQRARSTARVAELAEQVMPSSGGLHGHTGIAHTRWATHGAPAVHNAHPHFSHGAKATASTPRIALVHNGIIENHDELRPSLQAKGYQFDSQTDTEVMVHLIDSLYAGDLLSSNCMVPLPLRSWPATNPTASWAQEPVRPWCWASGKVNCFWPAMPWRWWA